MAFHSKAILNSMDPTYLKPFDKTAAFGFRNPDNVAAEMAALFLQRQHSVGAGRGGGKLAAIGRLEPSGSSFSTLQCAGAGAKWRVALSAAKQQLVGLRKGMQKDDAHAGGTFRMCHNVWSSPKADDFRNITRLTSTKPPPQHRTAITLSLPVLLHQLPMLRAQCRCVCGVGPGWR